MNDNLFNDNKNKTILLGLSVAYGIAFAVLFCFYDFGINVPIYTAAILAGTYWAISKRDDFNKMTFLFMAACIFILSLQFFVSLNGTLSGVNIILIPVLYTLSVCLSLKRSENIVISFLTQAFAPIGNMDKFPRMAAGMFKKDKEDSKTFLKIGIGVLSAVALLLVIVPLMRSADSAFAELTKNIFKTSTLSDELLKIVLGIVVCLYSFGYIYVCFFSSSLNKKEGDASQTVRYSVKYKTLEDKISAVNSSGAGILSFLVCVLCVFGVFCGFQIVYLFMKVSAGLPEGFEYAEYARSGVFSLWALTAIDLLIVLISRKSTLLITKIKQRTFAVVYTLYTLCNIVMSLASAYKMNMYIAEFGYTRARLLVMIYLVLQVIMLCVLIVSLYVKKLSFIKIAAIAALCAYCAVNVVNIDTCVTKLMLTRYDQTGKIDTDYLLYELSGDAFATYSNYFCDKYGYELTFMKEEDRESFSKNISDILHDDSMSEEEKDKKILHYDMQLRLNNYFERYERTNWRETNLKLNSLVNSFR